MKLISWFQAFALKFSLYRYNTVSLWDAEGVLVDSATLSGEGKKGTSFARDADGVGVGSGAALFTFLLFFFM
jgi:hypothetical protein